MGKGKDEGKEKNKFDWQKFSQEEAELTETRREEFLENIGVREQGLSAEKEKFIMGLHTGSPKMPYPNKKKE